MLREIYFEDPLSCHFSVSVPTILVVQAGVSFSEQLGDGVSG